MENKNMTAAREWENDPNCFLRMLNSPAQQRSRAARRQKDADRERFNNVLNAVAIGASSLCRHPCSLSASLSDGGISYG